MCPESLPLVLPGTFLSAQLQALLHGHSYTAHPAGCTAACVSLRLFWDPSFNQNLCQETNKLEEVMTSTADLHVLSVGVSHDNAAFNALTQLVALCLQL